MPDLNIYQSSWDKVISDFKFQNLLQSSHTTNEKACLLAVSSRNSYDWLNAIPIASLGLKLDPMSLKISCAHWLVTTLCHYHKCICGDDEDSFGHHSLSCKNQMGRRSRHEEVNDLIKRALVQAKIPAIKEPSSLSRTDGKRLDGLTLTTWKNGKCLIWDVTEADTVCQSYVNLCSVNPGAAADICESQKISKYKNLANGYCFVPVGIETFGSWGSEGHSLIKAIEKRISEATGEIRSTSFLFQQISIAIRHGNSSCVIGTVPHTKGLDEVFEFVSD